VNGSGARWLGLAIALLGSATVAAYLAITPWSTVTALADRAGGAVVVDPSRDFTAAEQARASQWAAATRPWALAAIGVSLLVAVLLGVTPAGSRLVESAGRFVGGGRVPTVVLGGLLVALLPTLATVPISVVLELRRRAAGLSTRDWWGFARDVAVGAAFTAAITVAGLLVVVLLAGRLGHRWWTVAAPGAAALAIVAGLVYPLVVEPLFSRFEPLPAGPVRDDVMQLADRAGLEVGDVLVSDTSRRSTTLNAYVSGLGPTRRVVLQDTLLAAAEPAEIRAVVAHEISHARRGDVVRGTLVGALGAALGVLLIAAAQQWRPLTSAARVDGPWDPRAIGLILALVAVLGTVAGPVVNLASRRVEAHADVAAMDLTRDPAGLASAMRLLGLRNLSDPSPPAVVYGLFASHPTTPERIALARTWARANGVPEPPDLVAAPDREDR
jgi:STE24 endopeptidase